MLHLLKHLYQKMLTRFWIVVSITALAYVLDSCTNGKIWIVSPQQTGCVWTEWSDWKDWQMFNAHKSSRPFEIPRLLQYRERTLTCWPFGTIPNCIEWLFSHEDAIEMQINKAVILVPMLFGILILLATMFFLQLNAAMALFAISLILYALVCDIIRDALIYDRILSIKHDVVGCVLGILGCDIGILILTKGPYRNFKAFIVWCAFVFLQIIKLQVLKFPSTKFDHGMKFGFAITCAYAMKFILFRRMQPVMIQLYGMVIALLLSYGLHPWSYVFLGAPIISFLDGEVNEMLETMLNHPFTFPYSGPVYLHLPWRQVSILPKRSQNSIFQPCQVNDFNMLDDPNFVPRLSVIHVAEFIEYDDYCSVKMWRLSLISGYHEKVCRFDFPNDAPTEWKTAFQSHGVVFAARIEFNWTAVVISLGVYDERNSAQQFTVIRLPIRPSGIFDLQKIICDGRLYNLDESLRGWHCTLIIAYNDARYSNPINQNMHPVVLAMLRYEIPYDADADGPIRLDWQEITIGRMFDNPDIIPISHQVGMRNVGFGVEMPNHQMIFLFFDTKSRALSGLRTTRQFYETNIDPYNLLLTLPFPDDILDHDGDLALLTNAQCVLVMDDGGIWQIELGQASLKWLAAEIALKNWKEKLMTVQSMRVSSGLKMDGHLPRAEEEQTEESDQSQQDDEFNDGESHDSEESQLHSEESNDDDESEE